ncbi:outer membrane beta-barrel protein [Ningiella sp. W23]|uniref:outer membrane beta-barrel protein n=1 Tax=Ningiella sp. W23 TaxID=3023715 RepID=UPI0037582FA4
MQLIKKSFVCSLLLAGLSVNTAMAQWTVAGGYTNISEDETGLDLSLSMASVGVGYTFETESGSWSFMPELRAGVGIGDDTVRDVSVEVNRFLAVSLRANAHLSDTITLFAQPSYANLDLEASAFRQSFSESDTSFGIGAGINAQVSETLSIEAMYENFDDTDFIGASIRVTY